MYRNRRRVLVAGGAGFIGSHLCDALLSDGYPVVCVDNLQTGTVANIAHLSNDGRFEFLEADIVEPLSPKLDVGVICNLACAASPPQYQADPIHTLMSCVYGTKNLLSLAVERNARFLLASTSEIYGDPEVHPQVETYHGNVNPTGPRACYDEGKRAAEALCSDFRRVKQVDARVVRIFNTFGPRMRGDDGRVVSNAIGQALAGEDVTIYGDGSQTRSFCYVDDMVDALLRVSMRRDPLPGPLNLGNPTEISVRDLVTLVLELTHSRSRVVRRRLPVDDPRRRRPDITLARTLLQWEPKTPLRLGLERTIAWFAREQARPGHPRTRRADRIDAASSPDLPADMLAAARAAAGS